MARTINEIRDSIIAAKEADGELSVLTSSSAKAIWRRWAYVVAVAQWTLEVLYDKTIAEIAALLRELKPHTLRWYVNKAKAFQYGYSLVEGSDVYETDVPAARIVSQAAAIERYGQVVLKVAQGSPLGPLDPDALAAFTAYMGRIKDAGVSLQIVTANADDLRIDLTVYYDPLVLAADGSRLDGSSATPVKDAINAYLLALPFNGLIVFNRMTDAIEATAGVVIGDITRVQVRYGALAYTDRTVQYNPNSGYAVIDDAYFDDHITYVPHDTL